VAAVASEGGLDAPLSHTSNTKSSVYGAAPRNARLDCGGAEPRLRAPAPQQAGAQGKRARKIAGGKPPVNRRGASGVFPGRIGRAAVVLINLRIPPIERKVWDHAGLPVGVRFSYVGFHWITSCIGITFYFIFTKARA
jgi:hypothetical protein